METRAQAHFPPTLLAPNRIARRRESPSGAVIERRNPAQRDDLVTVAPASDADTVRRACEAARVAQREWARVAAPDRAAVIGRLALLLRERRVPLARFVAREVGEPIREARIGVRAAVEAAEFFHGEGRRLVGRTAPSELPERELLAIRRPVGVVGLLTPGCCPLAIAAAKIFPAVLCGNAVVWKPSEDAPGTASILADWIAEAGLPPGVLQVVHGGGPGGAGAALVAQVAEGGVDTIAFTGSTAVGREVGAACGRALAVPALDLSAKNPLVILADADLEAAVDGTLWAAFSGSGQRCTKIANVIVDRRVLPLVREQLARRARSLVIGDPRREDVEVGPMMQERHLRAYLEQRGIGVEEGAELLLDGRRIGAVDAPAGFSGDASRGLYVGPRIFDRVKPTMRIAQEECLGPTVNLIEVGSLDEALAAATAAPYALAAALYTRDARAMLRFRDEVAVATVTINTSTVGTEAHLPQGGNRGSGNGTRSGGVWALDTVTRWQAVHIDYSGRFQPPRETDDGTPSTLDPGMMALGGDP
jgi:acyl-CoA reductase-like NAD-dependent aldehyde dehydrogenase